MKPQHPVLSIIIPCYNVQDYVQAALQSILDNTQPENRPRLELIIINDGATDQTPALINQFARSSPIAAHVIHQANAGLSAARNAGITQAQGDYYFFLDSDDILHHRAVDKILDNLSQHQPDILEFDATVFYGEQNWAAHTLYHAYFADIANLTAQGQPETQNIQRAFAENRWYAWSRVYHRKLFAHQQFEVGKLFEDFMTVPYLYFAAERIFRLPESLLGYRQNAASITANVSHRHLADIFYGLQKAIAAEAQYPNHLAELHILQLKTWRLIVAYSVKQFLRTRDAAYLANVSKFRAQLPAPQKNWGWQLSYFGGVVGKRLWAKICPKAA